MIDNDGVQQIELRLRMIDAAQGAYVRHSKALDAAFANGGNEPAGGVDRLVELSRATDLARAALEGTVRGILERERQRGNRSLGARLGWQERRRREQESGR